MANQSELNLPISASCHINLCNISWRAKVMRIWGVIFTTRPGTMGFSSSYTTAVLHPVRTSGIKHPGIYCWVNEYITEGIWNDAANKSHRKERETFLNHRISVEICPCDVLSVNILVSSQIDALTSFCGVKGHDRQIWMLSAECARMKQNVERDVFPLNLFLWVFKAFKRPHVGSFLLRPQRSRSHKKAEWCTGALGPLIQI